VAGLMKVVEAVPSLHRLVQTRFARPKEEDQALQVEACVSLGMIGDVRSVEVLLEVVNVPWWERLFRVKDQAVRGAALEALAHFPGDPRVLKRVKGLSNSKDPILRQTARRLLQRLG